MRCWIAVLGLLVGSLCVWGDEWELVYPEEYQPNPEYRYSIIQGTIAQWNELAFIWKNALVITIDTDGQWQEHPLPDYRIYPRSWGQLLSADATYYARVHYEDPSRNQMVWTEDFLNWNQQWMGNDDQLIAGQNSLARFSKELTEQFNPSFQLALWDTDERSFNEIYRKEVSYSHDDPFGPERYAVYWPRKNAWCLFVHDPDGQYGNIGLIGENGEPNWFLRFVPQNDILTFSNISCPDGERLLIFGDTSELVIIESDGSFTSVDLVAEDASNDLHIDAIRFINGWYYIIGSQPVRTRDFSEFESLDLPNSAPLVDMIGFNGDRYAFFDDSVFKIPMERGFLDSIIEKQGWRQSDWLGWFQINNEEAGDIDHLLLGDCWVKQVDDQQYWLRTSTLGWIWMNKDWAPWFWRMEDSHWYWLDPDGWPPRAWDYEDQEWEELKP